MAGAARTRCLLAQEHPLPRMLSGTEEMKQGNLSRGQPPPPSVRSHTLLGRLGMQRQVPFNLSFLKSQVATRFHLHEPKTRTDVQNVSESICVPCLNSPQTWLFFPLLGICYTYKHRSDMQQNLESLSQKMMPCTN